MFNLGAKNETFSFQNTVTTIDLVLDVHKAALLLSIALMKMVMLLACHQILTVCIIEKRYACVFRAAEEGGRVCQTSHSQLRLIRRLLPLLTRLSF